MSLISAARFFPSATRKLDATTSNAPHFPGMRYPRRTCIDDRRRADDLFSRTEIEFVGVNPPHSASSWRNARDLFLHRSLFSSSSPALLAFSSLCLLCLCVASILCIHCVDGGSRQSTSIRLCASTVASGASLTRCGDSAAIPWNVAYSNEKIYTKAFTQ